MSFGEYIPLNYGSSVNFLQDAMLSGQTQTALQQRYDVNTAKLEQLVDKVSAVPILQKDAKMYLGKKIEGALNIVTANIKAGRGQGLLSNSVTSQLGSYITDTLNDEKVQKHLKYSAEILNFEKGVNKLKEKDPKTFNQNNYEYAKYKAEYNEYLNGDIDSDLKTLTYKPYTGDPSEKIIKKVEEIKRIRGKEIVEFQDPNDPSKKIKREVEGLTTEELLRYIPEILDSDSEQQLVIDGWAEARKNPEQVKNNFIETVKNTINEIDTEIKKLGAINKNNSSVKEYEDAQRQLKLYQEKKTSYENSLTEDLPLERAGYIIKKSNLVKSLANMFGARPNETYELDDVWKAKEDLTLSKEKNALELEKLRLDIEKAKKEVSEKTAVNPQDITFQPVKDDTYEDKEPEKVYSNVRTKIKETSDILTNKIQEAFKDITDEKVKTSFEANMKKFGYVYKNGNFIDKNSVDLKDNQSVGIQYQSPLSMFAPNIIRKDVQQNTTVQNKNVEKPKVSLTEALRASYFMSKANLVDGRASNIEKDIVDAYIDNTRLNKVYGKAYQEAKKNNLEGTLPSEKEVGIALSNTSEGRAIEDKNRIIISGKAAQTVLSKISTDYLEGENFSKDPTITVKKNSDGSFDIEEYKGTKEGKVKIASAKGVPAKGGFSDFINSAVQEKEKTLNSLEFDPNIPIKSNLGHSIYSFKDGIASQGVLANINKNIANKDFKTTLALFVNKTDSEGLLEAVLVKKGIEPQKAKKEAIDIVNKVSSKNMYSELVPTSLGWNVRFSNGSSWQLGNTNLLDKDDLYAQQLYPAQYTLNLIYKKLLNEDADKVLEMIK